MPEIQQALPKYVQIASYLRDQIVRGDLRPGDEVPSERELAASWSVARPTAAKALEVLRVQGFVAARQGAGTYVRDVHAVPRARERYSQADAPGGMYSAAESIDFLDISEAPAPEHVVHTLGLAEGGAGLRRVRLLRGVGGVPIELSTSWYRPEVARTVPGLLQPERLTGGTAKHIAAALGLEVAYGQDQAAARLADEEERRLLHLPDPSAVLVYRLSVFASDGQPIQCDDAVHPPERWALRQEYPL